jgi:hypothetical protein
LRSGLWNWFLPEEEKFKGSHDSCLNLKSFSVDKEIFLCVLLKARYKLLVWNVSVTLLLVSMNSVFFLSFSYWVVLPGGEYVWVVLVAFLTVPITIP